MREDPESDGYKRFDVRPEDEYPIDDPEHLNMIRDAHMKIAETRLLPTVWGMENGMCNDKLFDMLGDQIAWVARSGRQPLRDLMVMPLPVFRWWYDRFVSVVRDETEPEK